MPILDQYGNPIPSKPPSNDTPSPIKGVYHRFYNYPSRGLTPERLGNLLREADEGFLQDQAELFQEIEERDGKLFQLMQDRKMAVVGVNWAVEPANSSAQAVKIADAFREVWAQLSRVDLMLDLLDAVGQGVSLVGMAWQRDGGVWWPARMEQIEAKFLIYRYELGRFVVRTLEQPGGWLPEYGQVIEHRYKARSGSPTRAGLMRTNVWWYLFKHYAVKDWVVYGELYGQPYRLGKYDPSTGKDERDALEAAVVGLGSDAAGVISKDTEIEIIEVAQRGGPEVYAQLVELASREMTLAVLGQTLTSGEGAHGTQALGKVHQRTRFDLLQADIQALENTLRRDLVLPFVAFNFGADKLALAPRINGVVEEGEDLLQSAQTLQIVQQMGLPMPLRWMQEKFGVPAAQDGEPVLTAPAPVAPAQPVPPPAKVANESRLALERLASIPKGILDGQGYIYGLKAEALELGQRDLNPSLTALLGQIDQASDYDDLRRRLLGLFPELDPSGISQVLESAWLLANLAGQLALREDTK